MKTLSRVASARRTSRNWKNNNRFWNWRAISTTFIASISGVDHAPTNCVNWLTPWTLQTRLCYNSWHDARIRTNLEHRVKSPETLSIIVISEFNHVLWLLVLGMAIILIMVIVTPLFVSPLVQNEAAALSSYGHFTPTKQFHPVSPFYFNYFN